ncbi:hypothetical protein EC844_12630 [Acinetobacter calcoaceticus]|uniref:Uncharacterized protein n=1 Tax=Acinetobacter calcoaceticus TaxID=471 RepID=A0A4R1XFJ0_ACICA|nr:hypothetical protein EC844_12630 [Acinetobacter calcoaceticus]
MNNPKAQYWIFIIITILYFLILHQFFDVTFIKVKSLPVNVLGDFLAGTFSPLAFLFLILGYLQTNKSLGQNSEAITQQAIALQQQATSLQMQSDELKISNQALQAQATELRNSVEQQMEQVRISNEQLDYYKQKDINDSEKEIRKAKPELHLARYGSGHTFGSYRLMNLGGEAKLIKSTDVNNIAFPILPPKQSHTFDLEQNLEELTFTYSDQFGNKYSSRFKAESSGICDFEITSTQSL